MLSRPVHSVLSQVYRNLAYVRHFVCKKRLSLIHGVVILSQGIFQPVGLAAAIVGVIVTGYAAIRLLKCILELYASTAYSVANLRSGETITCQP